jgi:ATP:corrinoid adenosyltransferase
MSIEKALETLKYDVRLIEYHLNNGMLTHAELEKHIKEIPDSSQLIALGTTTDPEIIEESDLTQTH